MSAWTPLPRPPSSDRGEDEDELRIGPSTAQKRNKQPSLSRKVSRSERDHKSPGAVPRLPMPHQAPAASQPVLPRSAAFATASSTSQRGPGMSASQPVHRSQTFSSNNKAHSPTKASLFRRGAELNSASDEELFGPLISGLSAPTKRYNSLTKLSTRSSQKMPLKKRAVPKDEDVIDLCSDSDIIIISSDSDGETPRLLKTAAVVEKQAASQPRATQSPPKPLSREKSTKDSNLPARQQRTVASTAENLEDQIADLHIEPDMSDAHPLSSSPGPLFPRSPSHPDSVTSAASIADRAPVKSLEQRFRLEPKHNGAGGLWRGTLKVAEDRRGSQVFDVGSSGTPKVVSTSKSSPPPHNFDSPASLKPQPATSRTVRQQTDGHTESDLVQVLNKAAIHNSQPELALPQPSSTTSPTPISPAPVTSGRTSEWKRRYNQATQQLVSQAVVPSWKPNFEVARVVEAVPDPEASMVNPSDENRDIAVDQTSTISGNSTDTSETLPEPVVRHRQIQTARKTMSRRGAPKRFAEGPRLPAPTSADDEHLHPGPPQEIHQGISEGLNGLLTHETATDTSSDDDRGIVETLLLSSDVVVPPSRPKRTRQQTERYQMTKLPVVSRRRRSSRSSQTSDSDSLPLTPASVLEVAYTASGLAYGGIVPTYGDFGDGNVFLNFHTAIGKELVPRVLWATDLPHGLHDQINKLPPGFENNTSLRHIFEAMVMKNTVEDEPTAPRIPVENYVNEEPCPPFEFYYTNEMWLADDVPPPDLTQLQGCDCRGLCNPNSKTCSCLKRQQEMNARLGCQESGFMYGADGTLKDWSYPIYECNSLCGCSDECRNRVVQRGRQCEVKIVRTEKKGWGISTGSKEIPAGTYLGIYSGELLTSKEHDERGEVYDEVGRTYLFGIDSWWRKEIESPSLDLFVIDAFHAGNFTRFFNHSCEPNCVIESVFIDETATNRASLALFTYRKIYPGEELTFSYSGWDSESDVDDTVVNEKVAKTRGKGKGKGKIKSSQGSKGANIPAEHLHKCYCGARSCKGYMFIVEDQEDE